MMLGLTFPRGVIMKNETPRVGNSKSLLLRFNLWGDSHSVKYALFTFKHTQLPGKYNNIYIVYLNYRVCGETANRDPGKSYICICTFQIKYMLDYDARVRCIYTLNYLYARSTILYM